MFHIPLVGVNHIEGHMASVWPIHGVNGSSPTPPRFPALALVVSGGHSELQLVKKFGAYRCLGRTRDDAAGEAFDKVAALLHLPYPGGPQVSTRAKKGNRHAFNFPRPMLTHNNHEFSFAGLKTAVRYALPKKLTQKIINDICASFEQAVIDVLTEKTLKAARVTKAKSVWLVGGVSANTYLRTTLKHRLLSLKIPLLCAPHSLTQDNATMIAIAAALGKKQGSLSVWRHMGPEPNWELG
jgi:N6-L-threonylcarbamoyladenine synthase